MPDDLVRSLETMIELVFERGRPSNRAVLQAVYARTPRGQQHNAAAREVNRALESLHGQTLAQLRVTASPSQQTLIVETERVRVQVEFDRHGVHISQLEGG